MFGVMLDDTNPKVSTSTPLECQEREKAGLSTVIWRQQSQIEVNPMFGV